MRITKIAGGCLLLTVFMAACAPQDEAKVETAPVTVETEAAMEVGDNAKAPKDALILFDGKKVDQLVADGGKEEFPWLIQDGHMEVVTGAGSLVTEKAYNDFRMHVEFATPDMPGKKGQARGNSGVYIQRRYEIQILDSYGDEPVINSCAAIYKFRPADSNQCRKPTEWQAYDILFRAARWDGEGDDAKKTENARVSVWHNGVLVHDDVELPNKTGAGKPEGPAPGQILLQNHKDQVRFRNVWIVEM